MSRRAGIRPYAIESPHYSRVNPGQYAYVIAASMLLNPCHYSRVNPARTPIESPQDFPDMDETLQTSGVINIGYFEKYVAIKYKYIVSGLGTIGLCFGNSLLCYMT